MQTFESREEKNPVRGDSFKILAWKNGFDSPPVGVEPRDLPSDIVEDSSLSPGYKTKADAQRVANECLARLRELPVREIRDSLFELYSVHSARSVFNVAPLIERWRQMTLPDTDLRLFHANCVREISCGGPKPESLYSPFIITGGLPKEAMLALKISKLISGSDDPNQWDTGRILVNRLGEPKAVIFNGPNWLNPIWSPYMAAWVIDFKGVIREVV